MVERVEIGDAVLYRGDCLEVMAGLEPVDSVVTDPPYGINIAVRGTIGSGKLAKTTNYGKSNWDKTPCSPEQIKSMRDISRFQIIFGGNYFDLPPSSCWLVWDKQNGSNNFADCELAWTNLPKAVRRIYWRWNGMIRKGKDVRVHPTQKPVGVMEWCIGHLPDTDGIILDPFMGSGTTGVACAKLGRRFVGIEIDERYFDIACARIQKAYDQPDLFIEPPAKVVQEILVLDE